MARRARAVRDILLLLATFYLCFMLVKRRPTALPEEGEDAREPKALLHLDVNHSADEEVAASGSSRPVFILAFSSFARSGSTLLAELFGSLKGSVVFFEPMWVHQFTGCAENATCTEGYVRSIFQCTFADEFDRWLRSKGLFFGYFSPEVKACNQKGNKAKECKDSLNIREMCQNAPIRVMKIIRGRLSAMEPMMRDPEVNFKAIFLTRDPRASLLSIKKMGWGHDPFWHCSRMESDQLAYERLSALYPDSVMHLRLEDLSIDPFGKSKEMMTFISGDPTIPDSLRRFLEEHMMTQSHRGAMDTHKNSSAEYDSWRYRITEDKLRTIEEEPTCSRSLQRMGHTVFGSVRKAADPAIPLFT